MKQLENKVAVITGSSRGIGFAIAKAFVSEGAKVVIASRSAADVKQAVSLLDENGHLAVGMAVDVSQLDQVQSLANLAMERFEKMDIWVNNAGTAGPYGATIDLSPDAFVQVIQSNIMGTYHGSRTAMRIFLNQGYGKLINLLGHGYKGAVPFQNAYASSKAWVRAFTQNLAQETKISEVGVFAFNPGLVMTDLVTEVDAIEGMQERLKNFPVVLRLFAREADVPARKAVWIASSATDGKTGLEISVSSTGTVVSSLMREVWERMLRKHSPEPKVNIKPIPPADG